MLTGWEFAVEGRKMTQFDVVCRALGVEFNFSKSEHRIMEVYNTASRVEELLGIINKVLTSRTLPKHEALVLRGKLGFADSYLHGRLETTC